MPQNKEKKRIFSSKRKCFRKREFFLDQIRLNGKELVWFGPEAKVTFIAQDGLIYGEKKEINEFKKNISPSYFNKYFKISPLSTKCHKMLWRIYNEKNFLNLQNNKRTKQLQKIEIIKEIGNELFLSEFYDLAFFEYRRCIYFIEKLQQYTRNKHSFQYKIYILKAKILNNISAYFLKQKKYEQALHCCNVALLLNSNYDKVQQRRNYILTKYLKEKK